MYPTLRNANTRKATPKVPGTRFHEQGPRGRIEFADEDNSTLHVHAYARVKSAQRLAVPVRSSKPRTGASAHAC